LVETVSVLCHAAHISGDPRPGTRLAFGPRIYANSIPKAGTNLLKRLLNLLPCVVSAWTYHLDNWILGSDKQLDLVRRGQVVTAHAPWSPELAQRLRDKSFRTFLMIRDLRDIAVSNAFYIAYQDKTHRLHPYYQALPSDSERLMASIAGIREHFFRMALHRSRGENMPQDFYPG
jgi:hypothetical protein